MTRWALAFLATISLTGGATAQTPVERGSYLVNTIMTCANCHSPKGPPQATAGKDFSGGLSWDEPPFKVTAPNITEDKDTGIGKYTLDEVKKTIQSGVRPNGVPLAPIMPSGFYGILTPGDLNAIGAYVKTIKAVSNKVPDPVYKMAFTLHRFPGTEKPMPEADMKDKVKHGFYLASIGHCMECHTGALQLDKIGTGGRDFPGPWGVVRSRNITSSKTAGIGAWTDAEIKTAITQGKRKDGTPLKGPMGFQYYAKMTDSDLNDVIAWLRTVPAKD
jgi:mono/diheme cytochrome c family protein